ncbi:MAG: cytochrome c oxidase accessory protein CcoG [Rhizobiaceae bacterium]|nr:cytochrome c oxidase accessory protein CcoG [Rhizobiaceae bacterium]
MNIETKERVETFDAQAVNSKENRDLYEARTKIHPKRTNGWFRSFKWWIMGITLGVYYITPWLRWDRGEYAPDQAVLLDMANRRFYFFFIEIWPHEFFYVAGLLVMAGIGLFLVTSTVGRAWCGYSCPQTVWVDLFLVVERFFEGDRNQRIKLDKQPWSMSKFRKRAFKHIVWILIGISTGGAWIFYFADAPTLFVELFTGQAAFVAYATVGVLAATTYVFGGFMREQVCTYMCPWPRIQAAMLDERSLTVTYNNWRGEPRTKHAKKAKREGKSVGDCVDCNACVVVCPMGIDIRDGQQLECITCALCIDACDGVMAKLGLEKGLISYSTLGIFDANMAFAANEPIIARASNPDEFSIAQLAAVDPKQVRDEKGSLFPKFLHAHWRTVVHMRTMIYVSLYSMIGLALVLTMIFRSNLDVKVLPDRNPIFVTLSDGSIRNGYEIKILNMVAEPATFDVHIDGLPGGFVKIAGNDTNFGQTLEIDADPDRLRSTKIYVTVPKASITGTSMKFRFTVTRHSDKVEAVYDANFVAPEGAKK